MKDLINFMPVFEMAGVKGMKRRTKAEIEADRKGETKEWPENEKEIKKDPEIKNATPATEIDLQKVKPIGPIKVQPGQDADKNGTKGLWAVDEPDANWEEQLAKLDIDTLDDNAYELSERFDDKHDFLVLGEAGWAKTAIIKAMAKKHGYHVLTVYLDKAVATDLGGIPVPAETNEGHLYMHYSVPGWALYMVEHPKDKFLLFFDEMNQAAPDVLNALMPIVLEHTVCAIKFDNMIVGAAGNLAKENASLSELNKPLRDRFKPIIEWEVHTPEAWKSTFEYLHNEYDKKIGKEIISKFEDMCDYWNSPRDITRVIFEFVESNRGRDVRKYSRVKSIVHKLEAIIWDDLDESTLNGRQYEQDMEELANFISDYIRNDGKKEEEKIETPKQEELSQEEQDARIEDNTNMQIALERGYYNSGKEIYLCTVDNIVTCLFDPAETGVTAEVLKKMIKKMKADGRAPKYNTVDAGRDDAKNNGWGVPEYVNGKILLNGEVIEGFICPDHLVNQRKATPKTASKKQSHSND